MRLTHLLLSLTLATSVAAQTKSPRKMPSTLDGKEIYVAYCASCHGLEGKGNGPVAVALKDPTPDLTTITKRNKGTFPGADLEKLILNDSAKPRAAHGTRTMPVWGPVFHVVENDQDLAPVRIRRLVDYLKTLQAP